MIGQIHSLVIARDESYPRVNYSSRRNKGVDASRLVAYAKSEVDSYAADIHVTSRVKYDVVPLDPGIYAAPSEIVALIRGTGAEILTRPVAINGDPHYETVCCATVIDALDPDFSEIEYVGPARIPQISTWIWRPSALSIPMFRIPQNDAAIWVNDAFVSAVAGRVLGFSFRPRGAVARKP